MHLLSLVVIILYFFIKPKTKSLTFLVIIAIASFIESLTADFSDLIQKPIFIAIGAITIGGYLFIEIIYFLFFIKEHIQSRLAKKIISNTPFVFIGYTIILVISAFLTRHSTTALHAKVTTCLSNVFSIESFLIIMSCLYFFYELFIHNPIKENLSLPAIWAISGMLILSGTIIPFFLFAIYLAKNNQLMMHRLWAINYIAYSLLFITFIMAMLSDKKLTSFRKNTFWKISAPHKIVAYIFSQSIYFAFHT